LSKKYQDQYSDVVEDFSQKISTKLDAGMVMLMIFTGNYG
jgi:hypothetical protein